MSVETIVLDADGVIFNFLEPFKELASEITGREIKCVNKEWELHKRLNMTEAEVAKCIETFNSYQLWSALPLIEHADDAIRQLIEHGYKVNVVSSIPLEQVNSRREALARHNLNVTVIAVGLARTKSHVYDALRPDYVIDDYMQHIDEAKEQKVPNRFLIQSCPHLFDTSNATGVFNNLSQAVKHIFESSQQNAKVA